MFAIIKSSGRLVKVERCGRVLFVYSSGTRGPIVTNTGGLEHVPCVSVCTYDHRFQLLPRNYKP